jgi:hypothetical protein
MLNLKKSKKIGNKKTQAGQIAVGRSAVGGSPPPSR